jgi:Protein of unknown function (DUF4199)
MRRIILTHGVLAGVIIIGTMILAQTLGGDTDHGAGSLWFGYLTMLVALSLVFLGIKRHRDRDLGGVIKFGRAVLLGLGITLVASVIYVAAWETYLSLTDYAFIDQYVDSVVAAKEAKGLSGTALEAEVAKLEQLRTQYADPLFRMPMTFLEIFPVGLLITLVAAALLRNSRFLPA